MYQRSDLKNLYDRLKAQYPQYGLDFSGDPGGLPGGAGRPGPAHGGPRGVLFAFRLVPIDASNAVTQVPIFCPNRTKTALENGITPLPANTCKIPTDADDD